MKKYNVMDSDEYSKHLESYIANVKEQKEQDKIQVKMEKINKLYQYSIWDYMFPYHLVLDSRESFVIEKEPIKIPLTINLFKRRKTLLLASFTPKFSRILTTEERDARNKSEVIYFATNIFLKSLALILFMNVRIFNRKRPIIYELAFLYSGCYSFLLSSVAGLYLTWNGFMPVAERMVASRKKIKTDELLDYTELSEMKSYFYEYDNLLGHIHF